jgi:hypothetical protein
MFKTVRSRETRHIARVTRSETIQRGEPNNVRYEASRHFRKKRKYMRDKINEPATRIKNGNTRDLSRGTGEFKNTYHPRTNLANDGNSDLLQIPTIL